MSAPAPETKPKFCTTTQARIYDTFEVCITSDGVAHHFEPRPRQAYTIADAVLALAETLKANRITPTEFLATVGESPMEVSQVRLLECDDKTFVYFKSKAACSSDVIVDRLKDYYPMATAASVAATQVDDAPEALAQEEVQMVFAGHGSKGTSAPRPKAPKVRRVTTMDQGGGDSQARIGELMASLTPEDVAKGAVIVMGKNGPYIKTASGQTEEEDMENLIDQEGDEYPVDDGPEEVTVIRAPREEVPVAAPAPAPRKAPAIRTMTGDAAEKVMHVTPITPRVAVTLDPGATAEMDRALALQMGVDPNAEIAVSSGPVVAPEAGEAAVEGLTVSEEVGGGRRVKRQDVTKKDRGGSRPERPKRS